MVSKDRNDKDNSNNKSIKEAVSNEDSNRGAKDSKKTQNNNKQKTTVNYIDKYVGHKLKIRRKELGISQGALGEGAGGLTFQQIQKYESGTNRISSSKLYQFSIILNVSTSYFFKGIEESLLKDNQDYLLATTKETQLQKDMSSINKNLSKISNKKLRKVIVSIVKILGEVDGE